jgi:two-component system nitrogen regulation response regulator GlnG
VIALMQTNKQIWVVDDDKSIRWVLEKALEKAGFPVESFSDADAVVRALELAEPDVLISDIRMPGMDGIELLTHVNEHHPDLPVIIMTAHSDLDSAVSAYDQGAFEYLPKPFDLHEAVEQVERARKSREKAPNGFAGRQQYTPDIIGKAPAMQAVFRAIGRLAKSNITVLINGESGTGKELVAHALHKHSPRAAAPFIALNMAAIPRDLMESELFGHEKGAFTGAQSRRIGRFEQAEAGTLFLDEIGDMPAEAQTRLLRVLADSEYYRVGGITPVKSDVRIIAATHQDLESLVKKGLFREDLFHRLNVIRVHIPALRERREDIPLLTEYFMQSAAAELETDKKIMRADTIELMQAYSWPGNVRQLENIARWLTVMASGKEIYPQDMPPELEPETARVSADTGTWQNLLKAWAQQRLQTGASDLIGEASPVFETALIEAALDATGGHKQEAAKLLGWGRNTLTRKLKELAL